MNLLSKLIEFPRLWVFYRSAMDVFFGGLLTLVRHIMNRGYDSKINCFAVPSDI